MQTDGELYAGRNFMAGFRMLQEQSIIDAVGQAGATLSSKQSSVDAKRPPAPDSTHPWSGAGLNKEKIRIRQNYFNPDK